MNKRLFVAAVVLLLVVPATFVAVRTRATGGDPCDNYGDCVSSSITFIRSNPDGSLYLGDSFSVSVSISSGQNTRSYSISWSFDSSVFQRTGSTFTVAGNKTGIYAISASVTFTGSIQVGNTTQPFTSTLLTSQTVSIIPMNIQFRTTLVNVTDARGRLLRNPDGSFYRNDSFCDSWSATFAFASERTDIKINVTSIIDPEGVLRVLN